MVSLGKEGFLKIRFVVRLLYVHLVIFQYQFKNYQILSCINLERALGNAQSKCVYN